MPSLTLFLSLSKSNGLQCVDGFTPATLEALIKAVNEDVLIVVMMRHSVDVTVFSPITVKKKASGVGVDQHFNKGSLIKSLAFFLGFE